MKKSLKEKSVFILVGMPGSGKSTLAKKIAEKMGAEHLSSDQIREELFKSVQYETSGHNVVTKLREKAHRILYDRAIKILSKGNRVIIDATHLDPKKRVLAVKTLSKAVDKNKICFVIISTPTEVIEQRIKEKVGKFANEVETAYEGWKRVTSYFIQDFKDGKLEWPTKAENIDCFDYKELAHELAN